MNSLAPSLPRLSLCLTPLSLARLQLPVPLPISPLPLPAVPFVMGMGCLLQLWVQRSLSFVHGHLTETSAKSICNSCMNLYEVVAFMLVYAHIVAYANNHVQIWRAQSTEPLFQLFCYRTHDVAMIQPQHQPISDFLRPKESNKDCFLKNCHD